MVQLKAPLMSQSASKQLGKKLIFKTKNNKAFLTHYSKPGSVNPFTPSAEQTQMRAIYGEAVGVWKGFTDDQKDAYNQSAKYKSYSGFNLFIREYFEERQWQMYFSFHGQRVYGLYAYGKQ